MRCTPLLRCRPRFRCGRVTAEIAVLHACRELNVTFAAFSPVARGFLGGDLVDVATLDASDIRRTMPRFTPANYAANLTLLPAYRALAHAVGCSLSQLALAWLLRKAPHIIAIPGTTRVEHSQDDLAAVDVTLSAAAIAILDALINQHTVQGLRYSPQGTSEVDAENF